MAQPVSHLRLNCFDIADSSASTASACMHRDICYTSAECVPLYAIKYTDITRSTYVTSSCCRCSSSSRYISASITLVRAGANDMYHGPYTR